MLLAEETSADDFVAGWMCLSLAHTHTHIRSERIKAVSTPIGVGHVAATPGPFCGPLFVPLLCGKLLHFHRFSVTLTAVAVGLTRAHPLP